MRARTRLALFLALLACGGCGKEKSTKELLADLNSQEERDRIIAVRTLKGNAAQIVPALIPALQDKQSDVRLSAAIKLGSFGDQARDAIPALEAALRDRDARVREAAGIALSRIDPAHFPEPKR